MDIQKLLKLATKAAKAGGEFLRNNYYQETEVLKSEGKDIKLKNDWESERRILEVLQGESSFPILTEERGEQGVIHENEPFWIVDPLDGSMNYLKKIPLCCLSIALWQGDKPLLGVIYDFCHDDLYTAAQGQGAKCNGNKILVSSVDEKAKGVIATGFPVNLDYQGPGLNAFIEKVTSFKKVRFLGSAALSIAFVASGKVDVYIEDEIMLWDVAGGLALVLEAGGKVEVNNSKKNKWGRHIRCASHESLLEG